MSSSVKPDRHPGMIASSWVPACARTAEASASSSSREALRDGTGCPSPSLWVCDYEVDNLIAPSASVALSSVVIFAI